MNPAKKGKAGSDLLIERIRRVCKRLPEATEQVDGFGHRAFKVRGKSFAIAGPEGEEPSLSIKSDLATQDALIKRGGYSRTPYIGQHGWITVDNPKKPKWSEVEQLLIDAYRLAAPKRLAAQVE